MDFLKYLLSASTGLTYILFAFIILFTASLFRLKKIRKELTGDYQDEISFRRWEVLNKKTEFHVMFSLMMLFGAFVHFLLVHMCYETEKDLELTLAIEKSEVKEIDQTLVPYFTTDDEARVTFLTYVVKQCRSFDYSNECYIDEFSNTENYKALFPIIPEEMLVRCMASNDCPEILISASTKAIEKEAEWEAVLRDYNEKQRIKAEQAKWEAERPQRMEAKIDAMIKRDAEKQAENDELKAKIEKLEALLETKEG